jgi:hypothetical protein
MKGSSATSNPRSVAASLNYIRLRCRACGGWTNMMGRGEAFERLVSLGLCAACFAERYLRVPAGSKDGQFDCAKPPVPPLVQ